MKKLSFLTVFLVVLLSFEQQAFSAPEPKVVSGRPVFSILAVIDDFAHKYQNFFRLQEFRTRLIGVLQFCQEENVIEKLSKQNITGNEVEQHFHDKAAFPDLSDDDRFYHTALLMSFISGYSFGTYAAYAMQYKDQEQSVHDNICKEARVQVEDELKRTPGAENKGFLKYLEQSKSTVDAVFKKYNAQVLDLLWLTKCNEPDLTIIEFQRKIALDKGIEDILAQDKFKNYTQEQKQQAESIATMFLIGTGYGRISFHLRRIGDEESLKETCSTVVGQIKDEMGKK